MITRQEFEIFWNSVAGQDQVPGVYVYGFLSKGSMCDIKVSFEQLVESIHATCQIRNIDYECGTVAKVAVRLLSLPDDDSIWKNFLNKSLSVLLQGGCLVAWAGGVDCSSSPEILDPTSNSGNVYAAKSPTGQMLCNSALHEPIKFLTDEQLQGLWTIVQKCESEAAGRDT